MYVQLIDDEKSRTLVSAKSSEVKLGKSAKDKEKRKGATKISYELGKLVAQKALGKKIKQVVFDKGNSRYHGRIAALADGAREGGLKF